MMLGGTVDEVLARLSWADAQRTPLAGDASSRRYWRLSGPKGHAMLSHSPQPAGPDECRRFLRIAQWLRDRGYSAPRILADASEDGILVQEDLGELRFAEVIAKDPSQEIPLYTATAAFLRDLHRHSPPSDIPALDGPALSALTGLMHDWLLPGLGAATDPATDEIGPMIAALYDQLNDRPAVLSMRDFHAENLIWLPERDGLARVGLLDFQDAVATHPAYDIVSVLQDARRDVSASANRAVLAEYFGQNGLEETRFQTMFALLGAQRALRILAVFARLALRDGKTGYLRFVPRVQGHLAASLAHPALADLRRSVAAVLPLDAADLAERIRARCTPAH